MSDESTNLLQLIEQHAAIVAHAGNELAALLGSPQGAPERHSRIEALAEEGEVAARRTAVALHSTFVTPIPREAIEELTSGLRQILRLVNTTAALFEGLRIWHGHRDTERLVRSLDLALRELGHAIGGLRNPERRGSLRGNCDEIRRLVREARTLSLEARSRLFEQTRSPAEILKRITTLEPLERASRRCRDLAERVEGVMLAYEW